MFSLNPNRPAGDACAGFRELPKFPLPYTGSSEALDWLRTCLSQCNSSHRCAPQDAPLLPSRVVAIQGDHVVVEEGAGRKAFYTTLSHCWGGEDPLALTTTNASSLKTTGVPLLHLPPTFRDGIAVTGQLDRSIRYIWIDSLCILQDELADWHSEAVKMMEIYGNSYLNIAAKHAANAYEGCFAYVKEEPPHTSFPIPSSSVLVREVPRPTHHDHSVNHRDTQSHPAPLLKRGWVLQERLLSPRVVYFDRHELLWECQQHRECQCGAMIVMTGFKEYWAASLRSGERSAFAQEHPIAAWTKVLHKYTAMQLKFESDRLMALEGVVQKVRTLGVGGDYIAGMWTSRLER